MARKDGSMTEAKGESLNHSSMMKIEGQGDIVPPLGGL